MKWNLATMNNLPEVETAYKYKNHKGVWQYGAAGKGALLSLVAIVKGEVDIFWLDESPLPSNEDELWEDAAYILFRRHNPNADITSELSLRLLGGFKNDMKKLKQHFSITRK